MNINNGGPKRKKQAEEKTAQCNKLPRHIAKEEAKIRQSTKITDIVKFFQAWKQLKNPRTINQGKQSRINLIKTTNKRYIQKERRTSKGGRRTHGQLFGIQGR